MKKTQVKNAGMERKYVTILGLNILSTTTTSLLTAIEQKVSHNYEFGSRSSKFSILTPNPELVLASTKDSLLKDALSGADFPVPDGIGLRWASNFLHNKPLTIIPGRVLFEKLIELAEKKTWKVFLLGGLTNEAVLAAEHLISLYPNILISTSRGAMVAKNGEPATKADGKLMEQVIKRINTLKPDLLFVAFTNPKQEIWIHKNLPKLNVKGAMAVGGTFRYFAGLSMLPPKWMERAGLEWLWRLITEPGRIGRIWNAVVVFPARVIIEKYTKKSSSRH